MSINKRSRSLVRTIAQTMSSNKNSNNSTNIKCTNFIGNTCLHRTESWIKLYPFLKKCTPKCTPFFKTCTLAHKSTYNRVKLSLIYTRWEQMFKYFDGLFTRNSFFFFSEEILSFKIYWISVCFSISTPNHTALVVSLYIAYHYIYILNSLYFFSRSHQ